MANRNVYQVSDEVFIKSVRRNHNIHSALKDMGLNSRGAAYKTFKIRCIKLNIDLSHFGKDKDIRKTITDNQISTAVAENISRQAVLKILEVNPHTSANVNWINSKIKLLKLETSHWKGMGYLKGDTHNWSTSTPLEEILIENSSFLWNASLKKKLLKSNLLKYECYECGLSEWRNKPISLNLEHKNGNNTDNRLDNLCLLCPNCHSQTDTFAGRNKHKSK
jgi:hypothetical protein